MEEVASEDQNSEETKLDDTLVYKTDIDDELHETQEETNGRNGSWQEETNGRNGTQQEETNGRNGTQQEETNGTLQKLNLTIHVEKLCSIEYA